MQQAKVSDSFTLTLSKPAKSSGGDKYSARWPACDRDRSFYIPQHYSRPIAGTSKPSQNLSLQVNTRERSEDGYIRFSLVKHAKGSGDDRYTSGNDDVWKGDIYLPKQFRNDHNAVWVQAPHADSIDS
jgi:hypothetical protein